MKKLFLCASFADVANQLAENINETLLGKRITFIPTASIHEEVTFYVDEGKKALVNLGLIVEELDIASASLETIKTTLAMNDYIYISGGNTYFLLQQLRKTGTDKIIHQQILAGKVYIGESAGAIVLAPDLTYIEQMDDYSNFESDPFFTSTGLGLVDFYPLPHFNEAPFTMITQEIYDTYKDRISLVPTTNTQAILVNGNEFNIVE